MKILMVCAGGLSSSIVMKKVRKYGEETGEEIVIDAAPASEVEERWMNYDCILTAPQVRNKFNEIKEASGVPVAAMQPQDYAIANAANIVKLAKSIIK